MSSPVITTVAPALGGGTYSQPILDQYGKIYFNNRVSLIAKSFTSFGVDPDIQPISITFDVSVTLNSEEINLDYGTLTSPTGGPLNFESILTPSGRVINMGTITNPTP